MTNDTTINMAGWDALTTVERAQRIIDGQEREIAILTAERNAARQALADVRSTIIGAGVHHTNAEATLIAILEVGNEYIRAYRP